MRFDMRRTILCLAVLTALAGWAAAAPTKVFLSPDEALELAFPDCRIERTRVYLSEREVERLEKLGRVDFEGRMAFQYVATRAGRRVGTAYFDTHKVRTLKETVMVVVGPDARIQRVELLAFGEPEDYIPRGGWYGQFRGKALGDGVDLKHGIRGVAGATLTARATAGAARRSLALHRVLLEREHPGAQR